MYIPIYIYKFILHCYSSRNWSANRAAVFKWRQTFIDSAIVRVVKNPHAQQADENEWPAENKNMDMVFVFFVYSFFFFSFFFLGTVCGKHAFSNVTRKH